MDGFSTTTDLCRPDSHTDEPRYPFVRVQVPPVECESVSDTLWELGAQGIEEQDQSTLGGPPSGVTLVAFFPSEEEATQAAGLLPERYAPQVEHLVGDAWRDSWRAFFKPFRIGPRLVVQPSWEAAPTVPGDVVVTIDPGRAFGSGIHETTRLVLRELDRRIGGGETVLDVGCGSGILSIAALHLGARHALAIDIDSDARDVAQENARANQVASRLHASTTPVDKIRGDYAIVVANIEGPALIHLAPSIARIVEARGTLILSGILRDQVSSVASAYPTLRRVGLLPVENEWAALVMRAP